MKFTKGYWMNLPGVEAADCVQIREVKIEKDRVYLYSVPYPHDVRAMGGPVLELFITSPQPDILRTQAYHFMGSARKDPQFELNEAPQPLQVTETEKGLSIVSGKTELRITKNPASFTYYYNGKKLTQIGDRFGHAMISTMKTPEGPFMRCQMDLDIGEKVYGLGERFTPFVKNGQVVDMWNEDGGTCSEIAYKNIPFYLTNKGYGVLVNTSGKVSYEICSEVVTRVQFSVPGEKLDFMVIGGGDGKTVLQNYTALTGRPALPPAWSFGLWLTTSFTTSYDEKTVTSFVDGMSERKIPLHVFHFDCYWMKENEWCNFTWDEAMFDDVPGMLSRMKNEKGLKICVWINSYIGQKSPLFREAMERGYLLKRPNGDVWQWDLWQAGMGLVDFTNPAAWKWYQEKLRALLEMGVDCFKTDFGERIPTDVVYYDGSDPELMHNYYTYLYNKCVFELLEEYKGKNGACLFARSATVGGQKFPVHWGGDCSSNYPSMSESLRAGLSLCLSGFGFWSHDISGFEGTAPADVYKRWAAFGLLSTHSRLHGSNSYRVPWLFDEEAVDVLRKFTNLKCTLMPYLYSAAVETHRTGVPTMRAMVLEFPTDADPLNIPCADLDRQYMLGESLLVAPVFTREGDVDYYLPAGTWTGLLDNRTVEGGRWLHEVHDFMSLPLMVRENTLLPIGADDQNVEYDYGKDLTLHVFQLKTKAYTDIKDQNGDDLLQVSAENQNGTLTFHFEGKAENLKLLLRNISSVKEVSGAAAEQTGEGVLLAVNPELRNVTVRL
ncbi:alpha-xylosidase [Neglectibacter caecimuris]|mgnify:CR=1 FL=1|uniref:alpha-xylosidase n=1 Tax=Neglectibacter caecimuris TaxID=3093658 RepID=UPI002AC8B9EF|nr:alpha-xylosidase [Neglectibacter sp. M00184]